MEPSIFYASAAGGVAAILLILRFSRLIYRFLQRSVSVLLLRYVIYPLLVNRHALLGPWTRGAVSLHMLYWAVTIFCTCFQINSLSAAVTRTDLLGISLRLWQALHGSFGIIAVTLAMTHAVISLAIDRQSLAGSRYFYSLLGGSALLAVFVLSIRIFRYPSYELYLRGHQTLACLSLYAIWRHVRSKTLLPRLYIFVAVGSFVVTSVLQWGLIVYRNFSFKEGCCRAVVTRVDDAVRINIRLSRPIAVRAGQYVNIWIPSISFWSFLQSHPFMIVSWTDGEPMYLDLLIEPKTGFTHRLFRSALKTSLVNVEAETFSASDFRILWYSGPHGPGTEVGDFGTVLLIATGFGIAAQLPILTQLIQGFNQCEVRTRRVHLVWQLCAWEELKWAQDLLNKILEADVADNGYIFRITMYFEQGHYATGDPNYESRHERLAFHNGLMNVEKIIGSQIHPEDTPGSPRGLKYKRGDVLVAGKKILHDSSIV
ncbi:MAG: hypothetical protein Q9214_004070 [Letrouitia sp. 1 TL-2023]